MKLHSYSSVVAGVICVSVHCEAPAQEVASFPAAIESPAEASSPVVFSLYGEWRSQYGVERHRSLSQRGRMWGEIDVLPLPVADGELSFLANGTVDYDLAPMGRDGGERPARLDPGEVYARWSDGTWALSLGNRLVRWGVADGVSLSDVINPVREHDPLVSGRQSARRPVPLLHVQYGWSGRTVETVFLPEAGLYRYPASGSPWFPDASSLSLEDQGLLHDLSRDAQRHRPEGGMRLASYNENLDWAISAFHGFNDMPRLDTTSSTPRMNYDRMTSYVFTLSATVGESVLRGEVGVTPDYPFSGTSGELDRADRYGTVWGLDRSFDDDWSVSVQLFGMVAPKVSSEVNRMTNGGTWSVKKEWPVEKVSATLSGQRYFSLDSMAVDLSVEYEIDDWRKISLSYFTFSGSDNAYRRNDLLGITFRSYF